MSNITLNERWKKALLSCSLVLTVITAVFYQTLWSMIDTWWNYGTYTHGFVIFPISIYLLWQRKGELSQITPTFSWLGVVAILLSSTLWLVASLVGVILFMQVAFISMVIATVWALFGTRFFMASLFPLMYLYFAVPFGEQLIPVMIDLTAEFTVWAINLTGIPVYQEGRFLTLPTGNWEVAEACSGVRYIIASFALGSIFAYLNYQSLSKRTLFIILSLLVPILANGLRAFGIVMIGHYSDMALATGVDHLVYGWLFFGVVMFLLFWIGMFWADDEVELVITHAEETKQQQSNTVVPIVITIVVAVSGMLMETYLRGQQTQHKYAISLPSNVSTWQGPVDITTSWKPTFPGAQELKSAKYKAGDSQVHVYVAHYEKETDAGELISSTNRMFNLEKWEDESTRSFKVNENFAVKEIIYRGLGKKMLVWEWLEIGSNKTTNILVGKAYQAKNILMLRTHGNRAIALTTPYRGDLNHSRQTLINFVKKVPNISKPLGLVKHK